MKRPILSMASYFLVVCVILGTTACGTQESAQDTTGNVPSLASSSQARIASSISAYIEFLLDNDKTASVHMSDRQKAILNRALQNNGDISKADYDTAWSNFQQCVVDKGYKSPVITQYANGLRGTTFLVDVGDRGDEVLRKVLSDEGLCLQQEYGSVSDIYRMSVDNPGMIQDHDEGVADCLRRHTLVDKSYTGKDFSKEREESQELYSKLIESHPTQEATTQSWDAYSFDMQDAQAQVCLVTNSIDIRAELPDDSEVWHPFGT